MIFFIFDVFDWNEYKKNLITYSNQNTKEKFLMASKQGIDEEGNPLVELLSKQPGYTQKGDVASLKVESDNLRRILMDKKSKINSLESQIQYIEQSKKLIIRLIQDFQMSKQISFVDEDKIENPFSNLKEGTDIIRNGIKNYISRHEKICSKFEIEFQKNIFSLQQHLQNQQNQLQKELDKIQEYDHERLHKLHLIELAKNQKSILCQTIMMRRAALSRAIESDQALQAKIDNQMLTSQKELEKAQEQVQEQQELSKTLHQQFSEQQLSTRQTIQHHDEIAAQVDSLKRQYKKESHAHNCTLAKLDQKKEELEQLYLTVESYHDNLKSQELILAEDENKRLRSVISVEKNEAQAKLEKEEKKTKELEINIKNLQKVIVDLNSQIILTEQKLQTQMMKIPDFAQLHQALDRNMAQTKKYKEEVLQRKYILDEIRDRNRYLEQQEIQDSKQRMAYLKTIMPLQSEIKADTKLPQLMQEFMDQHKKMEEIIANTSF